MTLPTLVILAGGLATRLHPITERVPKSMVEVAGEPFIAHQLRLVARQGFRKVVILVGHLGDQIRQVVGDGSKFGLDVAFKSDGPVQLGTGGALRAAKKYLGNVFFITYGDSYLDIDVFPIWRKFQSQNFPVLMTMLHNKNQWDQSNSIFNGTLVLRHDKNLKGASGIEWIDFGLSIMKTEVIENWPSPDPFDLSEITMKLSLECKVVGYEVSKRFYEIGKPEGLKEATLYIKSQR